MLRHFSYQDLPPKRGKIIPLGLVMAVVDATDISCPFSQCQADLIQISLFFCLRLFKYTKTKLHRRTVQFRLKDLKLHNTDRVIPHDAPSETILCARDVTLFLDMQKNSIWGESTTMEATDITHGVPASAAARRFLYLCSHQADPDITICSYFLTKGTFP